MSKEVNKIKEVKTIYEKLQNARVEFLEKGIGKGGKNTYAKYDYFQLNDILPIANKVLNNNRLTPVFNLYELEGKLVIYDWDSDQTIVFRTENADATMLNKQGEPINLEIQTVGSQHTYLKRYLYMNALEIAESDIIEENTGKEGLTPKVTKKQKPPTSRPAEVPKATKEQIKDVIELFTPDRIEKMLKLYKVEKLQDMPKTEVDVIIQREELSKEKEKAKGKITMEVEKVKSLDDLGE